MSRRFDWVLLDGAVEALEAVAVVLAREARKRLKPKPRSRGATLRPGLETPLWNALIAQVRPRLRKRGAKVLLARDLALAPARVSEFVAGTAMPDAERALLLLLWLVRHSRPQSTRRSLRNT
jgi:hypothetical protein